MPSTSIRQISKRLAQQLLCHLLMGNLHLRNGEIIDEKSQIRFYILSYLSENPESGDTVDGIQWWLLDRWLKRVSPMIQLVINELVGEGLILQYEAGDSRIHYSINHNKYKEIIEFLKK